VQHAYWLLENARPSESRRPPPKRGEHARTPPSAFPFLHITMSKSRWTWSEPHARTPDGSKSSIRSQRQSKLCEKSRASSASVRRIARSRSIPQEALQPARTVHLGLEPPNVKGGSAEKCPMRFSSRGWQSGHIPARMRRHSPYVNGEVTIQGHCMVKNCRRGTEGT